MRQLKRKTVKMEAENKKASLRWNRGEITQYVPTSPQTLICIKLMFHPQTLLCAILKLSCEYKCYKRHDVLQQAREGANKSEVCRQRRVLAAMALETPNITQYRRPSVCSCSLLASIFHRHVYRRKVALHRINPRASLQSKLWSCDVFGRDLFLLALCRFIGKTI